MLEKNVYKIIGVALNILHKI